MKNKYLNSLAYLGVGGAHPGGFQLTKYILSKEEITNEKKILDVGCGTGKTAAYIAKNFRCNVTALDVHPEMLKKARRRFTNQSLPINVVEGSVENVPFEQEMFDIVLVESVIVFTDVTKTLAELKRILNHDGVLYAIEMVLESNSEQLSLNAIKDFYGVPEIFTEQEWEQAFRNAGFTSIKIEKYEIDEADFNLEQAPEFELSNNENMDEYYAMLFDHQVLSETFKHKLGFRIFKCTL
ncbi:class I SAM-dependent methyltransferase [Virgibacillus soli]|uniref:Class I SAM-dependent methyltransferase n=1 Tax=Paracerasibacillus soli TaxID=480284 RepID=A0ABU5CNT1_9BACI|nr:class I SAM-dependent methyltransferase [Virgibacillus soli]MDY0408000.1 class I SAM-dependent methyltransferase [Virgibacillus soli]